MPCLLPTYATLYSVKLEELNLLFVYTCARPPSPEPPEDGTVVQRNTRRKVCAYCKAPGARLKCKACLHRTYCDKKCQKKDWKEVHKKQCKKLQQVFVPPPAGWREAAGAEGAGAGAGAAAAAAGGASDDDEIAHPCPVCLDNEDDAHVHDQAPGHCSACGQMYCGPCKAGGLVDRSPSCPTCRAPLIVSDEEDFKRLWKLVHDRSPGRHAPMAQYYLGIHYYAGIGVGQDYKEAVKWYRLSAEHGFAEAQCNLCNMYETGKGVKRDFKKAATWCKKAATQGNAAAQYNLGLMYDHGDGVEQDYKAAVGWYRKAAAQGNAMAQCNLGASFFDGLGVAEDVKKGLKWLQLSAEQNNPQAVGNLDKMLLQNRVPTPPPGTAVTAILLTSAAGRKHNNTPGIVVTPADGAVVRPGRVAVLLDEEATQSRSS